MIIMMPSNGARYCPLSTPWRSSRVAAMLNIRLKFKTIAPRSAPACSGSAHNEFGQGCIDIPEVPFRHLRSVLDHKARDTDVFGSVDGQRRCHATVAHEEGREIPRRGVAADHHALGGTRKSHDLEVVLVLVGPCPRNFAEGLLLSQHISSCGRTLMLRVLPVFDPNSTAEEVVGMVSDIAGGEHVIDRCLAILVNDDSIPGSESRTPGEVQIGQQPDSYHYHRRFVHPTIAHHYPLHVPVALDAFDASARAQLNAAFTVQIRVDLTDRGTESAPQRDLRDLEHGDFAAERAGARGNLGTDKPGPDHHDLRCGDEMLTKRQGVIESAEVEHTRQIRPGDIQGSWDPSGGDKKLVVRKASAAGQLDRTRAWINRDRPEAELKLYILVRVPRGWAQPSPLRRFLAAEHVFGQRGAGVRRVVLVAHDDHASVEALGTQRRCCSRARKPATQQDERGLGQRTVSMRRTTSGGSVGGSFRWWRLAHVNRALGALKGAFPSLGLQSRRHDVTLHIGKPLLVELVHLRTNFGTSGVAAALRHVHLDVQRRGLIGHTISLLVSSTASYMKTLMKTAPSAV